MITSGVYVTVALLLAASPFSFEGHLAEDWIAREAGWCFEAGTAIHADPFFHGGVLGLPGKHLGDVQVTAEVKINSVYHDPDTVWVGLLVRAHKPLSGEPRQGSYHFFLRANGESILQRDGTTTLYTVHTEQRPREEFVKLTLTAKGAHIRGYINGEKVIALKDNTFDAGEVALVHYGNEAVFREVTVKGDIVPKSPVLEVIPQQPTPVKQPLVTPISAIGIRKSDPGIAEFFKRKSGERFTPKGFNHTALSEVLTGWHATFNVGHYNPDSMEILLAAIADTGANTIRVWAWGLQDASGFTGSAKNCGLNGEYMENILDFLRRCTRHRLYAILILDETPHNAYYNGIAAKADRKLPTPHVTGYNLNYFSSGTLAAKEQATRDFVQYVKDADPGLLNTVLGWAFSNEAFVNHSEGPFNRNSGHVVVANGSTYDMNVKEQRQACYDESMLYWCNTLADAVKSVAPDALTTLGMWTSDAHGRVPVNYVLSDDRDPRHPPRPSVLACSESRLDFLDIHIYPWDGTSQIRPEAHEWNAVKYSGKPVLVGEYGVFKDKSIEEARIMMREMLAQVYNMGYQGSLHWIWDLTGVKGQTWSAVEEGLATYLMTLDVYPK
ncbi:MAG: DUF1080 domain-containing protein [Candidatus Hydrogenedentes bacterium]|nr:DUF1080 domain-containing protein [Candidatus Hydrogenedentota bacterium]